MLWSFKKVREIDNVFIPSGKYNLSTFNPYKGNNSYKKNDIFYPRYIRTVY